MMSKILPPKLYNYTAPVEIIIILQYNCVKVKVGNISKERTYTPLRGGALSEGRKTGCVFQLLTFAQ